MNQFRKLLSLVAAVTLTFSITHCSQQEQLVLPDLPTLATDVTSIETTRGAVTTFQVTIAAPGKFKELDATADKGTAVLSNIVGVGTESATATVTYTAPAEIGTATIHVKAIDKSSQNVGKDIAVNVGQAAPIDVEGGEVQGVWGPYVTVNVKGDLTIPAGKALVVREGTTVIMNGKYGIMADGNFYSLGSATYPNEFTISSEPTEVANLFSNVWNGVLGTMNSTEMVAVYTKFSFTTRAALDFNSGGEFIMAHDTVQYTQGDGVHIDQAEFLVANNTFLYNGEISGDALRIEDSAKGDVAFNLFIGSATNGVHAINATVNMYNNTAVQCGWRQVEADLGGSFTLEQGASGSVYSNMIANCKYGLLLRGDPFSPDLTKTKSGYSLYFGDNDESVAGFYPANGSVKIEDAALRHDIAGDKDANDPKFVTSPSKDVVMDPAYNLTIADDSPALAKGTTNFLRNFDKHTVGGIDYTVPAATATIGATTKAPVTTK